MRNYLVGAGKVEIGTGSESLQEAEMRRFDEGSRCFGLLASVVGRDSH